MTSPESPGNASSVSPAAVGAVPLLGIFLSVFLDLLGFGIAMPDIQLRASSLGATGITMGLTLGCFSLAQLLTAPLLGRLSDRIGRRKVLLVTTALSILSYVVYANAVSLGLIALSRVLCGVAGANVGVAYAYVADVTDDKNRARGMGLIGAAFGLGFVLGPGIGAVLLRMGNDRPTLLGYFAAGLGAINFVYILFLLPESLKPSVDAEAKTHFFAQFKTAVATPTLGLLLAMFFAAQYGFTHLEATFFRLLADPRAIFHLGLLDSKQDGAIILIAVGVVIAGTQGLLVNPVVKRFGEVRTLRFAYLLLVPALILVPYMPLWVPMLAGTIVLGGTNGLAQPSLSALISRSAPASMQGGIFGITSALGGTARFLAPLSANPLFEVKPALPYWVGAGVMLVPAVAAWFVKLHRTSET